jgi:hypothetical protein
MSAASVAAGLAAVQASQVPGTQVPTSAACFTPITVRGPYNGADPGSRFYIGDVARFSNGGSDPSKQFLNIVKAQAATEALLGAGIINPKIVLARHAFSTATPTVMITQNGTVSGGVFGKLAMNKWVPHTANVSVAPNFDTETTPGTVIASFPNGMALTTPVPPALVPAVGAFTQIGTPRGAESLAAQSINTSKTFGPPDVSIWSQLYSNGQTLPYTSVFSAPSPGDVTNLNYGSADLIAADAARAASRAEYAHSGAGAGIGPAPTLPAVSPQECCAACTGWR